MHPGLTKRPDSYHIADAGIARNGGKADIGRLWLAYTGQHRHEDEQLHSQTHNHYHPARMQKAAQFMLLRQKRCLYHSYACPSLSPPLRTFFYRMYANIYIIKTY